MDIQRAIACAALALAASTGAANHAHAQIEPATPVCDDLARLQVAWQNFDTQDVNASLAQVDQAAQQVSMALDRVAAEGRAMSPAAFDQLQQAHAAVLAAIEALPMQATATQVQDRIATAKDDERFAYQNFASNIACPQAPLRTLL